MAAHNKRKRSAAVNPPEARAGEGSEDDYAFCDEDESKDLRACSKELLEAVLELLPLLVQDNIWHDPDQHLVTCRGIQHQFVRARKLLTELCSMMEALHNRALAWPGSSSQGAAAEARLAAPAWPRNSGQGAAAAAGLACPAPSTFCLQFTPGRGPPPYTSESLSKIATLSEVLHVYEHGRNAPSMQLLEKDADSRKWRGRHHPDKDIKCRVCEHKQLVDLIKWYVATQCPHVEDKQEKLQQLDKLAAKESGSTVASGYLKWMRKLKAQQQPQQPLLAKQEPLLAKQQPLPTTAAAPPSEILERRVGSKPNSPTSLLPAPAAPPLLAPSSLTQQQQHLLLPRSPTSQLPAPAAPTLPPPSRLTQQQYQPPPSSPTPAAQPSSPCRLPGSSTSILTAAAAALAVARAKGLQVPSHLAPLATSLLAAAGRQAQPMRSIGGVSSAAGTEEGAGQAMQAGNLRGQPLPTTVDDVVSAFLGQQARRAQQSTGLLSGCSIFAAWRGTGSAWSAHPQCHAMFQEAAKRINEEQGRVRLATRKKKGQAHTA